MDGMLIIKQAETMSAQVAESLLACNDYTASHGLVLTRAQAVELSQRHKEALRSTGRVEFGESVLPKLVRAFCDSPFLMCDKYAETLAELQEAFYYFKNESCECISDDELIEHMREVFNGKAQGSVEYLTGTDLEDLCRKARGGR
ncbi:MAG: hypothetical protein EOM14_06060 [Clostridia bacterium]|nr:hypothetical protein [Clostridia bacterium]